MYPSNLINFTSGPNVLIGSYIENGEWALLSITIFNYFHNFIKINFFNQNKKQALVKLLVW
jgi:hypothetical protein